MKRCWLFLVASVFIMALYALNMGCREIIDVRTVAYDSVVNGCCNVTYWAHDYVAGRGTGPITYYCLALYDRFNGDEVVHGAEIEKPAGTEWVNLDLSLRVGIEDGISPDQYILRIQNVEHHGIFGSKVSVVEFTGDTIVVIPAWSVDSCNTACNGTGGDPCAPMKRHGFAGWVNKNGTRQGIPSIVGVQCSVLVRYSEGLCGEPMSTTAGFSLVSIGAGCDTSVGDNDFVWGSTGFVRLRFSGSDTVYNLAFSEEQGDSFKGEYDRAFFPDNGESFPLNNQTSVFRIELNILDGSWTAIVNWDTLRTMDTLGLWKHKLAQWTRYFGEVNLPDSKMPGTSSERVVLHHLYKMTDPQWEWIRDTLNLNKTTFELSWNRSKWESTIDPGAGKIEIYGK